MPDIAKAQMIIMAVGTYVTVLGYRHRYQANTLTIFLAAVFIYLGVCAPIGLNYFQHFLQGKPLNPELNFFWSFLAYWVGLKWCDLKLPHFSVDWDDGMNKSLLVFGFYQCLASCFAWNQIVFVFLMLPGLVFTLLVPWGAIWPETRMTTYIDRRGNQWTEYHD